MTAYWVQLPARGPRLNPASVSEIGGERGLASRNATEAHFSNAQMEHGFAPSAGGNVVGRLMDFRHRTDRKWLSARLSTFSNKNAMTGPL